MMAGGRFAKLGADLVDLELAAADRLGDAEILVEGEKFDSAAVMGLYRLEITLKIAICRRLDVAALPVDFQIHDLEGLLVLAGLSKRIKQPDSSKTKNHWDFITGKYGPDWINKPRYARGGHTSRQAKSFLQRLTDPSSGILPWLSSQT